MLTSLKGFEFGEEEVGWWHKIEVAKIELIFYKEEIVEYLYIQQCLSFISESLPVGYLDRDNSNQSKGLKMA